MGGVPKSQWTRAGTVETVIGLVILAILVAVAVWVLAVQNKFNPAVKALSQGQFYGQSWSGSETPTRDGGAADTKGFEQIAPDNLKPIGAVEQFGPDTLSDKIDGKAELYLVCGFESLRCQRFALRTDPNKWMEWFEYDMGDQYNAFAVYSLQRRESAVPLHFVPYAYRTKNAIFYVAGKSYIEAVAAEPDPTLIEAMIEMAKAHVATFPETPQELPELKWFPSEGLIPHSHTLQITGAFGFEKFTRVFSAKYNGEGREVRAFITQCDDSASASNLAAEYCKFLLDNGGQPISYASPMPELKIIKSYDGVTAVFVQGRFIAGVQGAESAEIAVQLAAQLQRRLSNWP